MVAGQNENEIANGTRDFNSKMKMNTNVNFNSKYELSKKVDRIADRLVEKLGNEQYRTFYCKVAHRLSEARIWSNLEAATKSAEAKGKDPAPLFTYLCKRDGV